MQEQLLETYNHLMARLDEVPAEMAELQQQITELGLDLADADRTLKDLEYQITEKVGGWSSLGSNDKAREAALKTALNRSGQYFEATKLQQRITRELAVARARFDDLTRRWAGVGYQARLHAGMLAYLGSAGVARPAQHPEVAFAGPRPRNGDTAYVTAADAAALGL